MSTLNHGHATATAAAKKVTHVAAKITGIFWGSIAKTTGGPRAASFVVSRRCLRKEAMAESTCFCARQGGKGEYYCYRLNSLSHSLTHSLTHKHTRTLLTLLPLLINRKREKKRGRERCVIIVADGVDAADGDDD